MIKTLTVTQSDIFLPNYGLDEVHQLIGTKVKTSTKFIRGLFHNSLPAQLFQLLTSNPETTMSNAMRGGKHL